MTAIMQLKITLQDSKPPIWRRVLMPADAALDDLHNVIQAVMGWENGHLHQFVDDKTRAYYSLPEFELEGYKSSLKVKLADILKREKSSIRYQYDFGDSWNHQVLLEKILDDDGKQVLPACIKGVRACPPEDCGGVWGYEELCDVLKNPKHKEHESMLEWLGLESGKEFDPEAFDLEQVNEALKPFAKRRKKKVA